VRFTKDPMRKVRNKVNKAQLYAIAYWFDLTYSFNINEVGSTR